MSFPPHMLGRQQFVDVLNAKVEAGCERWQAKQNGYGESVERFRRIGQRLKIKTFLESQYGGALYKFWKSANTALNAADDLWVQDERRFEQNMVRLARGGLEETALGARRRKWIDDSEIASIEAAWHIFWQTERQWVKKIKENRQAEEQEKSINADEMVNLIMRGTDGDRADYMKWVDLYITTAYETNHYLESITRATVVERIGLRGISPLQCDPETMVRADLEVFARQVAFFAQSLDRCDMVRCNVRNSAIPSLWSYKTASPHAQDYMLINSGMQCRVTDWTWGISESEDITLADFMSGFLIMFSKPSLVPLESTPFHWFLGIEKLLRLRKHCFMLRESERYEKIGVDINQQTVDGFSWMVLNDEEGSKKIRFNVVMDFLSAPEKFLMREYDKVVTFFRDRPILQSGFANIVAKHYLSDGDWDGNKAVDWILRSKRFLHGSRNYLAWAEVYKLGELYMRKRGKTLLVADALQRYKRLHAAAQNEEAVAQAEQARRQLEDSPLQEERSESSKKEDQLRDFLRGGLPAELRIKIS